MIGLYKAPPFPSELVPLIHNFFGMTDFEKTNGNATVSSAMCATCVPCLNSNIFQNTLSRCLINYYDSQIQHYHLEICGYVFHCLLKRSYSFIKNFRHRPNKIPPLCLQRWGQPCLCLLWWPGGCNHCHHYQNYSNKNILSLHLITMISLRFHWGQHRPSLFIF